MGRCRLTQTTHTLNGVCVFFILGMPDILGNWGFARYRVLFCVFVINLLIMLYSVNVFVNHYDVTMDPDGPSDYDYTHYCVDYRDDVSWADAMQFVDSWAHTPGFADVTIERAL